MCYLVTKDRDAHGCLALKTTHGKHLVELKRELNQAVGYKGVQLVTISRPTAYGEYAPYHFVDTEQEFRMIVKRLRPWIIKLFEGLSILLRGGLEGLPLILMEFLRV